MTRNHERPGRLVRALRALHRGTTPRPPAAKDPAAAQDPAAKGCAADGRRGVSDNETMTAVLAATTVATM